MFFEICGWLGCILLAICGLPEAWVAIKNKKTGLTWGLLLMWFFGEVLTVIYCFSLGSYPLLLNYFVNITILMPILWYKIFPGKEKSQQYEKK